MNRIGARILRLLSPHACELLKLDHRPNLLRDMRPDGVCSRYSGFLWGVSSAILRPPKANPVPARRDRIFFALQAALSDRDRRANSSVRRVLHPLGPRGLEPRTSSLSATRSSQLSYEPDNPSVSATVPSGVSAKPSPQVGRSACTRS